MKQSTPELICQAYVKYIHSYICLMHINVLSLCDFNLRF